MEHRDKFLILEEQDNIREILNFTIESQFNLEALRARNYQEASEILEKNSNIMFILCGETLDKSDAKRLFTSYIVSGLMSNCRFFDFTDNKEILEYDGITADKKIERKNSFKKIISLIEDFVLIDENFDKKEFTAVSIDTLSFFEGISTDLFLKLSSGRCIKLFKEGDIIDDDDITKYKNKNVEFLFIKKDTYKWILKMIKNSFDNVVDNKDLKIDLNSFFDENEFVDVDEVEKKISEEFSIPEETTKEIKEKTQKVILDMRKNTTLKNFLKRLSFDPNNEKILQERNNLVSFLACSLSKVLEWGSEGTYEKLVYSAHIQDLLLTNNPKLAMITTKSEFEEIKDTLSDNDIKLFEHHPTIMGQLIEKDNYAPKDAYHIVRQHHERPDGSGFPSGINHKRIVPMSALFIISLDLAHYIIKNPNNYDLKTFKELKRREYTGQSFYKILNALDEINT